MIILGKVRPLSRRLAEAHPQVLIIARAGTHEDPAAWAPNWSNSTVDMDVSPRTLARMMRIEWSEGDPWADSAVHEAGDLIYRHWLGQEA